MDVTRFVEPMHIYPKPDPDIGQLEDDKTGILKLYYITDVTFEGLNKDKK